MTQEAKTPRPQAPPAAPVNEDLSEAIEQSMERKPNEHVQTTRVFDDRYRCNWWVREKENHWLAFTSGRISRSMFVRATRPNGQLIIEDLSITSSEPK